VDVAAIALGEGLAGLLRLNVPTLLAYLRAAQAAGVKAKLKKEELVRLVLDHVGGTRPAA
jgi:hypothetical protein